MIVNDLTKDISDIMKEKKITKSEMARELGITRMNIQRSFTGKVSLPQRIIDIADKLGYDIEIKLVKKKK